MISIYVLAADDAPVFGFVPGDRREIANFAEFAGGLRDLLKAVRDPAAKLPTYNVVETHVPPGRRAGRATSRRCRRSGDRRAAGNRCRLDHPSRRKLFAATRARRCSWWLSRTSTRGSQNCSATTSAFRICSGSSTVHRRAMTSELVRSLDGAPVGLLAWRKDRPGLEFIRRVAPGLGTLAHPHRDAHLSCSSCGAIGRPSGWSKARSTPPPRHAPIRSPTC